MSVYSHRFVQYYGSLRVRVSLHGVAGRSLLLRSKAEESSIETSGTPDDDPIVCDRVTAVPHLFEPSGRSSFVESIVREVRRAFGELVFEPEDSHYGFESIEESLTPQAPVFSTTYAQPTSEE